MTVRVILNNEDVDMYWPGDIKKKTNKKQNIPRSQVQLYPHSEMTRNEM